MKIEKIFNDGTLLVNDGDKLSIMTRVEYNSRSKETISHSREVLDVLMSSFPHAYFMYADGTIIVNGQDSMIDADLKEFNKWMLDDSLSYTDVKNY